MSPGWGAGRGFGETSRRHLTDLALCPWGALGAADREGLRAGRPVPEGGCRVGGDEQTVFTCPRQGGDMQGARKAQVSR